MKNLVYLSFFLFFITSCAKTDSENIETKAFYPIYSVIYSGSGFAKATAQFQVGGSLGTYINLSEGDYVTVNGLSMTRSEILGMITYNADVPAFEEGSYEFTLHRKEEGGYTSSLTLPEGFTLTNSNIPNSFTLGTPLTLNWSGSGVDDKMEGHLSKSYFSGTNSSMSESEIQSVTLSRASMTFNSSQTQTRSPANGNVEAQVFIERIRQGSVHSVFEKGGRAFGAQSRSTNEFIMIK